MDINFTLRHTEPQCEIEAIQFFKTFKGDDGGYSFIKKKSVRVRLMFVFYFSFQYTGLLEKISSSSSAVHVRIFCHSDMNFIQLSDF